MRKVLLLIVLLGIAVLLASCRDSRDLSTPSSRLVGHWRGFFDDSREIFFGPIDDQTKIGNEVEVSNGNAFYHQYRVVQEELNGVKIVYEPFSDLIGVHPQKEFWITKDGKTMTNANNSLEVFEYLDSKTEP